MQYLTAEDILRAHSAVIDETGGSHGLRDRHAIATLEELPKQQAFGKELYPGMYQKAALYIRNLIFSHPFIDGNKRTAMTAADIFLQLNEYHISVEKGGVESFALSVIEKKLGIADIAKWLKNNTKKIRKTRW